MKLNFLSILPITLIAFISAQSLYSITNINKKSGIFYQNLGLAKISNDYFTLLSYTNLTIFELKLSLINLIYSKSLTLCEYHGTNDSSRCSEIMKHLQVQIPKLSKKLYTIHYLTSHQSRSKRGIFDGASYIFKSIYHLPDAKDAELYSDSINDLFSRQKNVETLMEQHIIILSSDILSYNQSALSLKANEETFNTNFQKVHTFNTNISNEVNNNLLVLEVISNHVNLLSNLSSELNKEFDLIIDSILFAKQNILHPSVITPLEFKDELLKIRLGPNSEFPVFLDNNEQSEKYSFINEISVLQKNNLLIYVIKIPLIEHETYDLYHLIPLPASFNQSYIYTYIDPQFPYLLMSTINMRYGRLKDISDCRQTTLKDFICRDPTTHSLSSQPTCETQMINIYTQKIPDDCSTKTMKAEMEIWHHLFENQWLFILTQPTSVTISCEHPSSPKINTIIRNTGIFSLNPRCKAYTGSTVLISSSNHTVNHSNYVPSININLDACCSRKIQQIFIQDREPVKLKNINLHQLQETHHHLTQLDEELKQTLENKPYYQKFFHWFNYFFSVVTLCIVMCCCIKCGCFRWLKNTFKCCQSCSKFVVCINRKHIIHSEFSEDQDVPMELHPMVYRSNTRQSITPDRSTKSFRM